MDISRDLENLHKQVDELESHYEDAERLESILLEAYTSFLAILESAQNNHSKTINQTDIDTDCEDVSQNILEVINHSQKKLAESEARYRTIVENQTELICRFTPGGILTFFNEAFLNYFSIYGEISVGKNYLTKLPKKINEEITQHIKDLTQRNPVTKMEYALHLPDGETRWQQWTVRGNFDGKKQLIETQAVGHDITDRKQAELSATQHNRELSALQTATAALLSTLDPEALLGRILDAAISAIPAANKGMIHLIAQDTGQLEMRASIGYQDPRIRRIKNPGSAGYISKAVRERTPLIINDLIDEPGSILGEEEQTRVIQSAIVAPLILRNQILGSLSLESHETGSFNESDLRLLVSFAATATAAIHNARLHQAVQKLAITDALTGLYNRRGLYELGQREVERARRFKRPLVAIMMDIDNFKSINDSYGHSSGDQVLQAIADRCRDNLRRIDIIGRLGGDEFAILLPETDMFRASGVAERVRLCIADVPIQTYGVSLEVSVSIGIARATNATPDLDILIGRADSALYTAKNGGRNRIEFM